MSNNIEIVRVHSWWSDTWTEFVPEEGLNENSEFGFCGTVPSSSSKVLNIQLGPFGGVSEVWFG